MGALVPRLRRRIEGAPRRQRLRPRRDDLPRPPDSRRLHHNHRGVPGLLPRRQKGPRGVVERGGPFGARPRSQARPASGRSRLSATGLGAFGRGGVDARNDGHRAQSRYQPRSRRGHRSAQRQPRLRLRTVPAIHTDVRRGGDGRRVVTLLRGTGRVAGPRGRRHHIPA